MKKSSTIALILILLVTIVVLVFVIFKILNKSAQTAKSGQFITFHGLSIEYPLTWNARISSNFPVTFYLVSDTPLTHVDNATGLSDEYITVQNSSDGVSSCIGGVMTYQNPGEQRKSFSNSKCTVVNGVLLYTMPEHADFLSMFDQIVQNIKQ